MEKIVKNVYELDCNWFANGVDAVGNSENSWKGNVICYQDGNCVGYATDNNHAAPTHLLIGSFVDGKGLSICKIHATNDVYDPIIFDVFANSNGQNDTYYGEFLAKTIFNFYPMGIASISAKQKSLDSEEISKIFAEYQKMSDDIKGRVGNSAYTLDMFQTMDYNDMAMKLQVVAESVKNEQLPKVFDGKSGTQPTT